MRDVKPASMLTVEQAQEKLLTDVRPLDGDEMVPITEALNRVTAGEIISDMKVPPADNSSMDGFALCTEGLVAPVTLAVSQRIAAGDIGVSLKPGTAARIFTGAPIPQGANAVVMQEDCNYDSRTVTVNELPSPGRNVRLAGEDIEIGDLVLEPGVRLQPQDIGLLASLGICELSVSRKSRVAIFSTGDELVNPGDVLPPGHIYNSNRFTLTALLQRLGCEVLDMGIIRDSLSATEEAFKEASGTADLIVTSGGVSVGEEDYVRVAADALGHIDLWKISIKPGKPVTYGRINDTPFIGLPGNPVSVFVTFLLFVRPYILKQMGARRLSLPGFDVMVDFDWSKPSARRSYLRARIRQENDGRLLAELYPNQSSGVLTSTSWADGLIIVPEDRIFSRLEQLRFIPFEGSL